MTFTSGGSNLRAGFIELLGSSTSDDSTLPGNINRLLEKSWQIGEDHKYNNPDELFVWIGKCIAEVVQDGVDKWGSKLPSDLPMGVTMSFPMMFDCPFIIVKRMATNMQIAKTNCQMQP